MTYGFGRIPSPPDARDYNLRSFMPMGAAPVGEKIWDYPSEPLNQLETNHCVGFSMAAFGINLPTNTNYTDEDGHNFYYLCKEEEGLPLEENGCYMRSGAKVLKNLGKINTYAFAPDLESILWWLVNKSPLMVGTVWTGEMFEPNPDNIITIGGSTFGHHAYLVNEVKDGYLGIQNSWGKGWGKNGKAYISIEDFGKLFLQDGEAITTVEIGEENMIKGIDVSHWQDDNSTPRKMDFSKAKEQGAEFVFIKASERLWADGDYIWNWNNAKEAGLLRGAYHFLRWNISGKRQAQFMCNDVLKGDWGELPLVADYEASSANSNSKVILEDFLKEAEKITGRVPMIYTSPGFWNSHGSKSSKWLHYPLWEAHYTKALRPMAIQPWGNKWLFWQHGVYPVGLAHGAESKNLDLNWFNGDMMDLLLLAGQEEDPPAPNPDMEIRVKELEKEQKSLEGWAKGIGYKG